MKIGVYQFGSTESIDDNFDAINRGIDRAREQNVRLLAFHECAACGYPPVETPDVAKIDFELLSRRTKEIEKRAREHNMYIALGTIRKSDAGYLNSIALIDPSGKTVGDYAKRALWGWDLDNFCKGDSPGVFEIGGVRVGFRICFEVRFPEYFRELFERQAELCIISFSDVSETDSPERYELIKSHLRTRAAENVMTVISVNSISKFQTAPTAVFDINGGIVAEAPKNEEYLLVYDYLKPEIGYGAEGRLRISRELLRL